MADNLNIKWLRNIAFSLFFIMLSPSLASAKSDSLAVFNISDINYKIERAKRTISKINFVESQENEIARIDSILDHQKEFINKQAEEFYSFKPNGLSKVFLANTFRIWKEYSNHLKKLNDSNNHRFEKTDIDSRTLSKLNSEFTELKQKLKEKKGYHLIIQRINDILDRIDKKQKEHYAFLKKVIKIEDKVDELTSIVDETLNYTQNLLNEKKKNTFKLTNPPIWKTQFEDGKYPNASSRLAKAWYENKKLIVNQVELVHDKIPFYFIYSLMLVSLIYFTRKKYIGLKLDTDTKGFVSINRILINNHIPVYIASVIALLLMMFPSTPILFSNFLGATLLLLTFFILKNSISDNDRKLIINYFIIVNIYNLEIIAWYFGGYARLYFLGEIGIALFLLIGYYYSFIKDPKQTSEFTNYSKKFLPIIIYAYIVSAIAQITGFVNLSILLNKILAIVPMITIIIYMSFKVLNVFINAIYDIISVRLPLFNEIFPKFLKRSLVINKIILFVTWFKLLAIAFQFDRTINQIISEVLDYSFTEGEQTITLGSILAFLVIVFATYYVSKITSKIFSNEKLRTSRKAPRGFFSATSLSLRMIIIMFGASLAMSIIGLDPNKFTIIAGALGVGIGFGLQDLVNNFISGLILIYGRPIQAGDTVEVDDLLGKVKEIGIRSSILNTYDGAEILVPNSILISNKLTNWTLSDNRKRVEVFVGVEYGANLEEVIEILEVAASRVDMILKTPEPVALFMEFGDSSLNFRLRYWVSYEDGFSSKSEVSIIIYKMLEEKGITIPFPQLDVHHFTDNNTEQNSETIDKE